MSRRPRQRIGRFLFFPTFFCWRCVKSTFSRLPSDFMRRSVRAVDSIRHVCKGACRARRANDCSSFSNLCRVVSQDPLIYADRSSTLFKAFHTNLIPSELQNLVLVKLLPNPYLNCSSLFRISPQQSILYHRICLIARYR